MTPPKYIMGVDVGGTFTDLVIIDQDSGNVSITKVPSTPRELVNAVVTAVERSGVEPGQIAAFVHGTTLGTNTVIERKGAEVGLITTKGFKDILEIQRGDRQHHYDLQWDKPKPLVPRYLRRDVRERVDYRGHVLTPLDEESVRTVAQFMKTESVEAIAICLLFSFMYPNHEQRVAEIVREIYPEAPLSISSQVMPEFREYERTSTAVVDAYIKPKMSQYLTELEERIAALGVQCTVSIMQSNGGISTVEDCRERPVNTLLSGPAGGVVAGRFFGELAGFESVITLDMGGTSCDVSLIYKGRPLHSTEGEIEWGVPVKVPTLDVLTIGAGGGSIAWMDRGGLLKVGPQSAGADPGPVCYGAGGTEPTVTDANVTLGRVNPEYLLGGAMLLDAEAAHRVIQDKVARPLNMGLEQAAQGILDIANANMIHLFRQISVERGYDPRDFALVAIGGAGPVHAGVLAEELGMPFIIVPPYPGVLSAMGLILGDIHYDLVQSYVRPASLIEVDIVRDMFARMEGQGRHYLIRAGYQGEVRIQHAVDMRYARQNYEIQVAVKPDFFADGDLSHLVHAFEEEYSKLYGYYVADEPFEIVSLRVSVIGQLPKPTAQAPPDGHRTVAEAVKAERPVYFREAGGKVVVPILDRERLPLGVALPAPCVIEEIESTVVIHSGQEASVDRYGNILIRTRAGKTREG